MYFLLIDTATGCGGVAVARNSEVTGLCMLKTPLRYSEQILCCVDFLLKQLKIAPADIDCFAVSNGPGSFTGLRIGIATTKGLAQALQKPCVAVPTLLALAWRFKDDGLPISVMVDARRQQIYGSLLQPVGAGLQDSIPPTVAAPHQWLERLPGRPCLMVGDGAQLYATAIRASRPDCRVLRSDNFILHSMGELAFRTYSEGGAVRAEELKANYVRPSDARLPNVDTGV